MEMERKCYLSNILSDTNCGGSEVIKIYYLSYFTINYINIKWDETSSRMSPPSTKPPGTKSPSTKLKWDETSITLTPNKNQKCDPLRAMKTFVRKKMGHTT